ncbi:Ferredoxin [Rhodovulum sp. PH10]|uniref:YkgJ family cysteine cluster protein n=1 Tax=Rhodovulum sp. PH10 TaxID=1187851 RepID=UPI00027C2B85|nr:YkgJ family cysteine cluster protein [Rhodovulum sp. PH10]EJW11178.1 Ferredoxin [Rhodovulum sp. PH10]
MSERHAARTATAPTPAAPTAPAGPPADALADALSAAIAAAGGCRTCGACCAYAADWPRFSLESEAALAAIPPELVAADGAGMRCIGDRCAALSGEVGVATACTIHPVRPEVCRACEPGDPECGLARARFGL